MFARSVKLESKEVVLALSKLDDAKIQVLTEILYKGSTLKIDKFC